MDSDRIDPPIGVYAILFGIFYWPIESLIHRIFFSNADFLTLFLHPEPNEAWMRLFISGSFIAFGIYAHRIIRTERLLNRELKHQQRKIRQVIDSAHEGYICINSDSVITDWNPMAEKMFGWSRGEAIGKPLLDTIVPDRFHKAHHLGMQTYLESSTGPWLYRTITTAARHKSGKEFDIVMAIIPLSSGDEQEFYAFIRPAGPLELDSTKW